MRYPDRMAKFIMNSPQLSNLLDGEGMGVAQFEEEQKIQMKEVEKEHSEHGGEADGEAWQAHPPVLWPAAAADALAEGEDLGDQAKGERHEDAGHKAGVEHSGLADDPVVVANLRLAVAGL